MRLIYFSLAFLASIPAAWAEDASQAFVEALATRASEISAADLQGDQARAQFRQLVNDGFAVEGIARFVLGLNWRQINDQERREYVRLFEQVLVDAAMTRLRQEGGFALETTSAKRLPSARAEESTTLVGSRLRLADGSTVRVEWRVASYRKVRRITDVVVEGISLATTYRDEYSSIARRQGLPALLEEMRQQRALLGSGQEDQGNRVLTQ